MDDNLAKNGLSSENGPRRFAFSQTDSAKAGCARMPLW
jgi:hypothetical protein